MADIYGIAWKMLEEKIARSRRRSVSKADLVQWQLQALEAAVDRVILEVVYQEMRKPRGQQKEA